MNAPSNDQEREAFEAWWFAPATVEALESMPSVEAECWLAWQASRASMLKAAPEAIAWATMNEEGEPAMLFFDKQEARSYCEEGEEPRALGFVDSPPASTNDSSGVGTGGKT